MSSIYGGETFVETIVTIAEHYRRLERILRLGVVLFAIIVCIALVLRFPRWIAVPLVILVLGSLAVPLFDIAGTIQLKSMEDPDVVLTDFASQLPPVLGFQWALADSIQETADGVSYEFTHLFGILTTSLRTNIAVDQANGIVELTCFENDSPWGSYLVFVNPTEDGTEVTLKVTADRRYELVRLTQLVAAAYYQDTMFETQGYEVCNRTRSIAFGPDVSGFVSKIASRIEQFR